MNIMKYYCLLILVFLFAACSEKNVSESSEMNTLLEDASDASDWWRNANIYEVNVRQYTPEGTFSAFRKHLPRLKEMGVDILWFMPVHPISETNKKGTLGSYYAISDYRGINPNFGTLVEFKDIIDEAHGMGMKVVMDWVANHTGYDHVWTNEHPDFYNRDVDGNILVPADNEGKLTDWTDVADLNYDNPEMRKTMIEDMKFWVRESDIDGFRCDVAFFTPDDFWPVVRKELEAIKPVFMLAESETAPHRNMHAFHATYGWGFFHMLNDIAKGKKDGNAIMEWYEKDMAAFNQGFQMSFITNHDENSWSGTIEERMGEADDAMAVLAFTLTGMPLIYSGQEAGLDHRLQFFEKDSIDWSNLKKEKFYTTLLDLKHRNQALWNGKYGGEFKRLKTDKDAEIFAYIREKNGDKVVVILNLTSYRQTVKIEGEGYEGDYNNVFGNMSVMLDTNKALQLGAWDYLVLEQ
jgi:glycosidase